MNISESLNHYLPKIEIIKPKNEVDYYGFSYYLSKKYNLNYNYSFSSWVHGWIFNDLKYIDQFNISQYSPNYKIVAKPFQKDFLENHGLKNVVTASYPYTYIDDISSIKRFNKSLLIMPPKNSINKISRFDESTFIESMKKYKKEFDEIYFCVDQISFENDLWINNLKKNNIKYVVGAHSLDSNSLLRTKVIFQHFEYIHSPVIGSALVYAALDGCKVSLSEDYLEYRIEDYLDHPLYKTKREYLEYEIYTKSKKFIENKFKFLFINPSKSKQMINWAKKELGFEYKVNFEKIEKILGWRLRDKLKFYPMKYYNSLNRLLK